MWDQITWNFEKKVQMEDINEQSISTWKFEANEYEL